MSTNELFRFRTVRPIQNKQTGFTALIVTPSKDLNQVLLTKAAQGIPTFLGTYVWLEEVSLTLAAALDDIAPADLVTMLPANWTTQVAAWAVLAQQLADVLAALATEVRNTVADGSNYGIPVIPSATTQEIELIVRLILVQDCIMTLAADQALPADQRTFQTGDDIRLALTFRTVSLPPTYFSSTPPVLARTPGVTDLSVVNDEWNRYIPDEIANVVNVLPGESFDSGSGHMEETVQTQSTTDQQTTTQTTENSQTTSNTLSSTATNDASTNVGVHGQVETSGQYGPTQVKTNIGGQAQFSQSSSQSNAITTSVETVARSVKTVSETITQTQSLRTTTKDTSHEDHKLENSGSDVTVGIYRWLSEVHRCQMVSYPNRLILEFEIPEPGAWLRWALNSQPEIPWDNPDPGPFVLDPTDASSPTIQPSDITTVLASTLAARWRVQGLTPPPPQSMTIGYAYNMKQGDPQTLADNTMAIPDGYQAVTWTADFGGMGGDDNQHATNLRVSVGGNGSDSPFNKDGAAQVFEGSLSGNVGPINTGTLPVYINGFYTIDISCNVTVQCEQIPDDASGDGQPYLAWQLSTFGQIASSYDALLSAHNQERDARLQQGTAPMVVGPPALNLSRAVGELKRLAIQNLLGQTFTGYDLLTIDPTTGQPSLDPAKTVASSPVIQFFEQAFEWENIVYICYPYFWGGQERWVANATWASADPVFDQFLNAGSVRLVVPATPGFEHAVNFFLYTSSIWSGKSPPGPNDPGYLSVADEIQSVQVGATDGTPIDPPWEITLPTTLLWAGTDPTTLPTNPNAMIGPPPANLSATPVPAAAGP